MLDWELSTLGDPLADLAYNCMPYHLPSVSAGAAGSAEQVLGWPSAIGLLVGMLLSVQVSGRLGTVPRDCHPSRVALLTTPSVPSSVQDIPTLVSLPHPLPPGIPNELQYIRMYCSARGLAHPLQACTQPAMLPSVPLC